MLRCVVNIIFLIKCNHWVSVISCSCAVQLSLTLTIKLILKFCRMVQLCKETCLYKSVCQFIIKSAYRGRVFVILVLDCKTKLLVISSRFRSRQMVSSIQVGTETIQHQPFEINLGVILDQDIAMDKHI